MKMAIRAFLQLPYTTKTENGWIIASCDLLDIHSQGKSRGEAAARLKEEIELFIECCYKGGTLNHILKECGFDKIDSGDELDEAVTGEIPGEEIVAVSVPLSLVIDPDHARHRNG